MSKKTYFIKEKNFNKMYMFAQEIFGNISIIKMFCKSFENVDEFYQITPLLNHTCKISDKLYAQLVEIKK